MTRAYTILDDLEDVAQLTGRLVPVIPRSSIQLLLSKRVEKSGPVLHQETIGDLAYEIKLSNKHFGMNEEIEVFTTVTNRGKEAYVQFLKNQKGNYEWIHIEKSTNQSFATCIIHESTNKAKF